MATHSNTLVWRIPRIEGPGGRQSMGSQRIRHDWATNTHTWTHLGDMLDSQIHVGYRCLGCRRVSPPAILLLSSKEPCNRQVLNTCCVLHPAWHASVCTQDRAFWSHAKTNAFPVHKTKPEHSPTTRQQLVLANVSVFSLPWVAVDFQGRRLVFYFLAPLTVYQLR